jgi:hypothetical protein
MQVGPAGAVIVAATSGSASAPHLIQGCGRTPRRNHGLTPPRRSEVLEQLPAAHCPLHLAQTCLGTWLRDSLSSVDSDNARPARKQVTCRLKEGSVSTS